MLVLPFINNIQHILPTVHQTCWLPHSDQDGFLRWTCLGEASLERGRQQDSALHNSRRCRSADHNGNRPQCISCKWARQQPCKTDIQQREAHGDSQGSMQRDPRAQHVAEDSGKAFPREGQLNLELEEQ